MKIQRVWGRLALIGLGFFCAACQAGAPFPPGAPLATAAPTRRAAVRVLDLSQVTLLPAPSAAPPAPVDLPTPTPIPSPSPSAAPAAAAAPTAAPTCHNQAELVRHLSVALNTALNANTAFGKVWRIRNTGDCTWTRAYQLVFDHGQAMSGPAALFLTADTPPGQTLDLRVGLQAPSQPGEQVGYWLLQSPQGQRFGLGPTGEQPLVVQILVRDPNAPRPFNFSCG